MALAGVAWPAFDRAMDDGRETGGVHLPKQPEVRRWLIGEYAAGVAQSAARSRAVNHFEAQPLRVWLFGGLDCPEMDAELARHGIPLAAPIKNTFHRTIEAYRARGTDETAIDAAIAAVQAAGGRVSRRTVQAALAAAGGSAAKAAIDAHLVALRASGALPRASLGGAVAADEKLARDAYKSLLLHHGPVFGGEEKEASKGISAGAGGHLVRETERPGTRRESPKSGPELIARPVPTPRRCDAKPAVVRINAGIVYDDATGLPWGRIDHLYARPSPPPPGKPVPGGILALIEAQMAVLRASPPVMLV